ncbi:type 1 glutamine amidotransferase [Schaalia vaccimaxillae]|uniref:type 1 glutamine amidotransferase n=1 Tax=Schaalia vaccimaxillae TaxID=183916 RepID=UPI0003B598A4|nr:type 1 glutamine amidotransferase [Schaalia vaccimaxillae]
MTVLVIQHEADVPLGLLSELLSSPRILRMWEDPLAVSEVLQWIDEGEPMPDSVLVLGGRQNAYADEAWPWLSDVRELIRRCIDSDVRVLGVCLGAQLIAVAAGGKVEVGAAAGPEYGVTRISWSDDFSADPLVSGLRNTRWVFEDHGDAIATLPAGGQVWASSEKYPQVISVGCAIGTQFHPEVTETIVRDWQADNADTDTEEIVAGFLAHRDELAQTCRVLAAWIH